MTSCAGQRGVDRHFAGRLGPRGEREMRAHLSGCAACRARYERHLALERLDPRRRPPSLRLGRALGLRRRAPGLGLPLGVALAAGLALVLHLARPAAPALVARGVGDASARLYAYGVGPGGPEPLDGVLRADDELAFAYDNPSGWRYLAVFAVDEHRHVHWFYPAWTAGPPPPAGVAIERGVARRELPEAVRHEIDGARLRLYAVFSAAPIGVAAIEAAVAAAPPLAAAIPLAVAAEQISRAIEVER